MFSGIHLGMYLCKRTLLLHNSSIKRVTCKFQQNISFFNMICFIIISLIFNMPKV